METWERAALQGVYDRLNFLKDFKNLLAKYDVEIGSEEHSYGWDGHFTTLNTNFKWKDTRHASDVEFDSSYIDIALIDKMLEAAEKDVQNIESVYKTQ